MDLRSELSQLYWYLNTAEQSREFNVLLPGCSGTVARWLIIHAWLLKCRLLLLFFTTNFQSCYGVYNLWTQIRHVAPFEDRTQSSLWDHLQRLCLQSDRWKISHILVRAWQVWQYWELTSIVRWEPLRLAMCDKSLCGRWSCSRCMP